MEIGKKIREARIAKGLTQEELGKIVGLQNSAIAKYENGRVVNIKRSTLQKLAIALDLRGSDLIIENEPIESAPTCCLSCSQRKEEVSLLFFNSRVLFPPPLSHAACG